jgi:hypothetical protein
MGATIGCVGSTVKRKNRLHEEQGTNLWLENQASKIQRVEVDSQVIRTKVSTAKFLGRGSQGSQECTPHRIGAAESAGCRDLFEAMVGSLEQAARCFGSHLQGTLRWRLSQLAGEYALKIPNAH